MPVTEIQRRIAALLASNRSIDSHLAGGAALHFKPESLRYSQDLDYFHDSVERVATAYAQDEARLTAEGFAIALEIKQPGYIRAVVRKGDASTKIEWSHDSDWRFMPVVRDEDCGYRLHDIDLAINKVLALAGRDEARDLLDVLYVDRKILPLGALCWAAAGKDPGFTPHSLLELLKRRGKFRPEDFQKLRLAEPVEITKIKSQWMASIEAAEDFIRLRPADEVGCLYYDEKERTFFAPDPKQPYAVHYGRPGGILPGFVNP